MKLQQRIIGAFLLFLAFPIICSSHTESAPFRIESVHSAVNVNEIFQVEVVVEFEGIITDYQAPSFEGFKLIAGPNPISSKVTIIKGKKLYTRTWTYTIESQKVGNFVIGPALIKIGDKQIESTMLDILVSVDSRKVESIFGDSFKLKEAVLFRIEANKTVAFVGEQVHLDLVLYTMNEVIPGKITEPEFIYFRKEKAKKRHFKTTKVEVAGKLYYRKTLKRIVLYPLKSGSFTIDSAKLMVKITPKDTTNSDQPPSVFINRLPSFDTTIFTDSVQINVKDLTGQYALPLDCRLTESTFANENQEAAEGQTVLITANTKGDINRLFAPNLGLPEETQVTVKLKDEKEYFENGELIGERTFEYQIFSKQKEVTLKPTLKYFDSKEAMIKVATLPKIKVKASEIRTFPNSKESRNNKKTSNFPADQILVVDISASMLAQDFKPERITKIRELLRAYLQDRPEMRIGLIAFAKNSRVLCPLSEEHAKIEALVDSLIVGSLEDGTNQGVAIATSLDLLKNSTADEKSIVLITDGIHNSGALHPLFAAQLATLTGIPIHIYQVGEPGRMLAPVNRKPDGTYYIRETDLKVNESLLKQMAEISGGQYYLIKKDSQLPAILSSLNDLKAVPIETDPRNSFHPDQLNMILKGYVYKDVQ